MREIEVGKPEKKEKREKRIYGRDRSRKNLKKKKR